MAGKVATIPEIIERETGVQATNSTTIEELALDSLDLISLFMAIEQEAGIQIPQGKAQNFQTVGEIASYVDAHILG